MLKARIRWLFIALIVILGLYFLFRVKTIISPFIAGAVLAYLLSPAVCWLEKKGLRRRGAVAVIFIWITIIVSVLLFMVLPKLYIELGKLAMVLPQKMQVIYDYSLSMKQLYSDSGLPSEINRLLDEKLLEGQELLIGWLERIIEGIPGLLASLGLLILAPILAIYYLIDWSKMTAGIIQIVPERVRGQWQRVLLEIDFIIQRYIQGNIIDALIVGVVIGLAAKFVGMDYSFVIGVICGITNLIPYFGPVLGWIPSVFLALSKSPAMAVKITLIIFIVQQIDGNIINPRLMSSKVGLHPLWVVFALLAGGELGGLMGMLIAIPLAAIVRLIVKEVYYYLVAPKVLQTPEE